MRTLSIVLRQAITMHMANELISIPVATGAMALSAGALGCICRKMTSVPVRTMTLMGVLGAFVFAAQMINVPLLGLAGASGHLNGAVLLTILLGPHAAALAMSSVVVVQCLLFQDGGLLALGCNLMNLAILPAYVGYGLYSLLRARSAAVWRVDAGAAVAALVTVQLSALLVVGQVKLSSTVMLPIGSFLISMLGVHLAVGVLEALLTVTVLRYLRRVKPDLVQHDRLPFDRLWGRQAVAGFAIGALLLGGGASLLASNRPDGLEWSYARHAGPAQNGSPQNTPSQTVAALADLHSRLAPLPNYGIRNAPLGQANTPGSNPQAGWTSFAGVVGTLTLMLLLWSGGRLLKRRRLQGAHS